MKRKRTKQSQSNIWTPDSHSEKVERRNDELLGPPEIDYYLVGLVVIGALLTFTAIWLFGSVRAW